MDTRYGPAALGFVLGGAIHALNAIVSFRERGFVEALDVPLALVLVGAAVFTWRRERAALVAGAVAAAVALVLILPSGAIGLVAFWAVVLVVAARALRPTA